VRSFSLILAIVLADPAGLAAEGQLADGYAVLLAGLRRAEEAQEAGEPWADELIGRYRLAIDKYVDSHGAPLE
jgi:hypothetical protein